MYNPLFDYHVSYSEEDEAFIAYMTEMPSMSAFGDTEEEAVRKLKSAVKELVNVLEAEGRSIPPSD